MPPMYQNCQVCISDLTLKQFNQIYSLKSLHKMYRKKLRLSVKNWDDFENLSSGNLGWLSWQPWPGNMQF